MGVPYTMGASWCFCAGEALAISRLMAQPMTWIQTGTFIRMQQGERFVSIREMQVVFQCPCRRSTIFSSLPAGGMHYDFLQFPSRRNSSDFQQSPCRGDARRFPQFPCRRNARRFPAVSLQAECPTISSSLPACEMLEDFPQSPASVSLEIHSFFEVRRPN